MKKSFLIPLLLFCAKKLPPPSPDRFPPRVKEIRPLYNNTLLIFFNEPLDTTSLNPSNFSLTKDTQHIQIRNLAFFNEKNTTLQIITASLNPEEKYTIKGFVKDKNKNQAFFSKSFKAIAKRDTIPPEIEKISPTTMFTSFPYNIRLKFSEPLDTLSSKLNFLSSIKDIYIEITKGIKEVKITVKDTIYKKTPFSFLILPTLYDFSKNPVLRYYSFFFIADTTLPIKTVIGKIEGEAKNENIVITAFYKQHLETCAISDTTGFFKLNLIQKDSIRLICFSDTNRDLYSEFFYDTLIEKVKDTLKIRLKEKKGSIIKILKIE